MSDNTFRRTLVLIGWEFAGFAVGMACVLGIIVWAHITSLLAANALGIGGALIGMFGGAAIYMRREYGRVW